MTKGRKTKHDRRGPKAASGKREPNGRLSRQPDLVAARGIEKMDRENRETIEPALAARERVHGVAPRHSVDQYAGSFVGRLFLSSEITRVQLEAANIYFEECARNAAVCRDIVPPQPQAVNLNATSGGRNNFEDEQVVMKVRAAYKSSRNAVQEKQNEVRGLANLFGALSICLLEDRAVPGLIGDLRIALNALAKHYGLLRRPEVWLDELMATTRDVKIRA